MVSLPPPYSKSSSITSTPSASTPSAPVTKPPTTRLAIARAVIRFSNPTPVHLIRNSLLKKGDVLGVARVAGIMAAKRTSDLVPLCHNIALGGVEVEVDVVGAARVDGGVDEETTHVDGNGQPDSATGPTPSSSYPTDASSTTTPLVAPAATESVGPFGGVVVTVKVHCFGQTGVEMEALVGAVVGAATVFDMCKGVDKGMRMEAGRVLLKEGGRSGTWREGVGP